MVTLQELDDTIIKRIKQAPADEQALVRDLGLTAKIVKSRVEALLQKGIITSFCPSKVGRPHPIYRIAEVRRR
jgi:predicted ArsR family transcriptional regulator